MNFDIIEEDDNVLGIVLYGSMARKDEDLSSDIDNLILVKDIDSEKLLKFKRKLANRYITVNESLSVYRISDFLSMAQSGSLFMWHIKLQGKIVFSRDNIVEKILADLKPYGKYAYDIEIYSKLLKDVEDSLKIYNICNEVDLALLFTLVRNICILLCFKHGTPKFGRSNAYLKAKSIFGNKFPISDWMYAELCAWKLWYERAIAIQERQISKVPINQMVNNTHNLINFAKEYCL